MKSPSSKAIHGAAFGIVWALERLTPPEAFAACVIALARVMGGRLNEKWDGAQAWEHFTTSSSEIRDLFVFAYDAERRGPVP